MEEYFTIEEACKKYKTSASAIKRKIVAGALPASKPFGKVLIKQADLEKLFKKTSVAS
jgi:excisionase family DNA binding protein